MFNRPHVIVGFYIPFTLICVGLALGVLWLFYKVIGLTMGSC